MLQKVRHSGARQARLTMVLVGKKGGTMTVKVDDVGPNLFPAIDHVDARDAGWHIEVFLQTKIERKQIPVTISLSYEQAGVLADLLEPFRKII